MSPQQIWNDTNLASATPAQMVTPAWAIANTLSAVKARLELDKQAAIASYNTQFDQYAKNRTNQPAITWPEPVPGCIEEITYNGYGFPELQPGTVEVCPRRVYVPPVVVSNPNGFGSNPWRTPPTDEFTGVGIFQTVKRADGTVWERVQ